MFRRRTDRWSLWGIGSIAALLMAPPAFSAETTGAAPMAKTLIVLKLETSDVVPIRTRFQDEPPLLTIEFPRGRVMSALPERSTIASGVVQAITAQYERRSSTSPRYLESIQLALAAPYTSHVESNPGAIVIELQHPASLESTAVEIGLKGGTIGGGRASISERFRAMQDALTQARAPAGMNSTPLPIFSATPRQWLLARPSPPSTSSQSPGRSQPASQRRGMGGASVTRTPVLVVGQHQPIPRAGLWWPFLVLLLPLVGVAAGWLVTHREQIEWRRGQTSTIHQRLASGVQLVDQLVWCAFERQGYQLVIEIERTQPPLLGTLRVIAKDGVKSALLFVGNGPFFEKQTVERFVRAMKDAGVSQGFLVASGSFTVPAQRVAKDRAVSLIGRDQLIELLSVGARSEYFTKQLEQQHAKLEEAKDTLKQYASELEILRRQRNEASWYLGEERAKSSKLEAQLDELNQHLRRYETEVKRWEQDATNFRKQWEESQWYLGESQTRARHLEAQLSALQDMAKQAEGIQQRWREAEWYLGEERARIDGLEGQLEELRKTAEDSQRQVDILQALAEALKQEIVALRQYGERRQRARANRKEATTELTNGKGAFLFSGSARNLSSGGIGLETEYELPTTSPVRIRLSLPGHELVQSEAQVVWQQALGSSPTTHYRSGCQFLNLPDEVRQQIERYLESCGPSTLDS